MERLRLTNRNSIKLKEPGLIGVGVEPHFAIGQRALFLRTPRANVLWDCLPLLDKAVVEWLKALGGVSVIAILHPYSPAWSRGAGSHYVHVRTDQFPRREVLPGPLGDSSALLDRSPRRDFRGREVG